MSTTLLVRRVWRSRGHAVLWSLSTVAAIVFGGALTLATSATWRLARAMPPTPPEVTRDVVVRGAEDQEGRRASFRILLFTDDFRWQLSSSDTLENGSKSPLFTPEMRTVLDAAQEVIVVGASSEEIPPGVAFETGRRLEERRAARRAEQIAVWVRASMSQPIPIRKLNAGYHLPTPRGTRDTSDQRRVVIILVLDRDDGTNIDEALRSAMTGERVRAPIFDMLLTQYSLAARPAFTWAP